MQEAAQKLIVALYAEANSPVPQLDAVNPGVLGMDTEAFNRAVNTLYTSGLVSGITVKFGDDDRQSERVYAKEVLLTRPGVDYVENLMEIDINSSKMDKLKKIALKAGKLGWSAVVTLAKRIMSEYTSAK
ncbi:MAG TPA: hypothetical protein PKA28_07840 [Methylomusa anaerophila]|uniref:DUF2513 domain-containing protein n=1 Tax=Methylomusa anaerophila TaxID=1930071 RepID=A0A348AFT2_9FIRM|nr:hypothetical protein [Methylomusa anaerophila]BBB89930.1 hypothetical protein MAMMFC1_00570 [Methylomusa anaerophila]HML88343.1 hypothetical protein [Methylomusa anaerophila]